MSRIFKTKDYDMFKKHESNRALDAANLRKIKYSIEKQNMLEYRPIIVDKEMRVIDGQHRLQAAKELGIEIYYQVNDKAVTEDIVLLNANQKVWGLKEYVDYYVTQGKEDFIRFKRFSEKHNIKIPMLVRMAMGNGPYKGNLIKGGWIKFPEEIIPEIEDTLKKVNNIILVMKRYVINKTSLLNSEKMRCALFFFLRNRSIDVELFENKIAYKADALRPCTDIHSYQILFRDIYNWKNHNPIE